MRFAHIIKRNETSETPQRFISLSLHIYPVRKSRVETIYMFDYGYAELAVRGRGESQWSVRSAEFETAKQWWAIAESWCREKTKTFCFVENSKKTLPLLDCFTLTWKRGWTCTLAVIECPPTIIRWRTPRGSFVLLEKQNIWREPSKSCSNGKNDVGPMSVCDDGERCRRVATIKQSVQSMRLSLAGWMNFLTINDLGSFAPTIAGQSMRVFRHKYMKHEILIDTNADALKLARAAYAGARTECFKLGKYEGEFYLVDVNSMYASVMRDMMVPVKLRGYTERATLADLVFWSDRDVIIADCEVETDEPCYAVKKDGRLSFPVGQFRTFLSGDEMLHALRNDSVRNIFRVSVYDGVQAFHDYMCSMWDYRQCELSAGNTVDADKYKMLMASFYGKWGQHGGVWEKVEDAQNASILQWIDVDFHDRTVNHYRQFGGIIQKLSNASESYESHPAISACVTANARMKLWSLISEAGKENVYYVDTDSLLVTRDGFTRLQRHMSTTNLGGLRLVGNYGDIEIFARKDYRFGTRLRRKGISQYASRISERSFEQEEQLSIKGMVRSGCMSTPNSRLVRRTLKT